MFFPDAPVPKRIGDYRVLRRVTVGEPFEVYVAKEEGALGFSREVTLRCLKRDEDPQRAAELAREARICTRLKHRSIEHVLGLVEERDRFVLVLEHAEGVTCDTLLDILAARDEELPFTAAAYIAGTVATALAAAHAHQGDSGLKAPILHRALGPAVVHVAMDGTVKLGGFGLAKILDRTPDSAVGLTGGTRRLSPEQKKGAAATEKSDVWSLGALCYTLFAGGTEGAPLLETIAGRPPKLDSVRNDVPLELAAAIDAALEEDPANRSITSAEIAKWIARTTSLEEGHRVLRALLESIPKEELGEPAAERGLRRVRAMERRASRGKILRKSMSERVSDSELEEVAPEVPPPVQPVSVPPVPMPTGRTNTMSGVGPSSIRAVAAAPVETAPARIPTPPRIATPPKIATPPPVIGPVIAAPPVPAPEPVPAPQPMPALATKMRSVPIPPVESLFDETQELPRAPRRRRRRIVFAIAGLATLTAVIVAVVFTSKRDLETTTSKPTASAASTTVASAKAVETTTTTTAPIVPAPQPSATPEAPKKQLPPHYGWLLVHAPPGKVMVAGKGRGAPEEVISAPCGKVYVTVAKVDSKDKWVGWAAKGQPFTIPCDGTIGEVTLSK